MAALKRRTKKRREEIEDEEEDLPKRKRKAKESEDVDDDDLDEDEEDEAEDSDDKDEESDDDSGDDEEEDEDEDDDEETPPRRSRSSRQKTKERSSSSRRERDTEKSKKKSKKKPSFLKTGKERAAAFKAEEARDKAREEERGKARRFFIHADKIDKDFLITFIDGDLDDDGILDTPTFREHSMKLNGKWTTFVSCEDDEPDPLQEQGKEPYFAQIFTIIDHDGYVDREGKEHINIKRPFVAKKKTIKQLQKIATKRGGLAGCTFTVSRTSDKDPNVGNNFDFEKKREGKTLIKFFMSEGMSKKEAMEAVEPFNYEEVLTYHSADELIDMGVCDKAETISSKKAKKRMKDMDDIDDDDDLDDDDL